MGGQLTTKERQAIVTLRGEGYSYRVLAKKLKIPLRTVAYTIKRHRQTGSNLDRKRARRPQYTSKAQDELIRDTSLCNRRLNAPEIKAQLNEHHGTKTSTSTVLRRLREVGLKGCVSARKPFLKVPNKRKRLVWAKERRDWCVEDWCKVLWTSESTFEICGSSRCYVHGYTGERMLPLCMASTVKYEGGSVMVWGCFAGSKVGNMHRVTGILNENGNLSILQRHAIPSGNRHATGHGPTLSELFEKEGKQREAKNYGLATTVT